MFDWNFFLKNEIQSKLQLRDRCIFSFPTKSLLIKELIETIFEFLTKCLLNRGPLIGVLTVSLKTHCSVVPTYLSKALEFNAVSIGSGKIRTAGVGRKAK